LKSDIYLFQDEVIIPTLVAVSYLKEQNLKKKAYILASVAVKEVFESSDIMCSSDVEVSVLFLQFFLHSPCSFIM
jgi:predicted ribosome-associated RNA-binding protein Tma20